MEKIQIKSFFSKVFFAGFVLGLLPFFAHAASITISPSSGTYSAGQQFTVDVYVSSTDQSMNAVSGTLSFPTKFLAVSSVSKSNSIISLWTIEPTFSNTDGSVTFEGIVLNPGFTGTNGKVISITFRALSAGVASVILNSGSILANDGAGTSIPTTLGSAQFTITPAVVVPVQIATTTVTTTPIAAPLASSSPCITVVRSSFLITLFGFTFNIFIAIAILAPILLIIAFFVGRSSTKKKKEKNEIIAVSTPVSIVPNAVPNSPVDVITNANKLAEIKFNYFSDYVNAQIDVLEKDERIKSMQGSLEVIENVRKHIDDFKDFIDKEKN